MGYNKTLDDCSAGNVSFISPRHQCWGSRGKQNSLFPWDQSLSAYWLPEQRLSLTGKNLGQTCWDISKVPSTNCNVQTTPPAQKCLPSPSLFNVVVCFLELQIFWRRTVHVQSNIERGKGRGKGNKNANVSLSCLNSFVRDWSSTCFFSCRLWTVIHPSIEQYPNP